MTALLANLDREGIDEVVIERREDRGLNHADRRTIHDARQAGLISESFCYRFEAPKEEPLLWVPDAIAGAVGMHLANKAHDYFDSGAERRHRREVPEAGTVWWSGTVAAGEQSVRATPEGDSG